VKRPKLRPTLLPATPGITNPIQPRSAKNGQNVGAMRSAGNAMKILGQADLRNCQSKALKYA
jgi:hypothetical protein